MMLVSFSRGAQEIRNPFQAWKSRCLSDFKFNSFHCSVSTLPPITIDDLTNFINSLIDHAEDVKVLRSKGILLNFLGSDQEVTDIFNEIARYLARNPHALGDVKDKIEKQRKNMDY
ncbi:hypothetical protein HAX54_011367 [Datura stramonium]|uniref:Uncharacterized protein n=1 Tax=Datura stramonium TaxID=4076 RepID=A0ABS8TIP0_DATST|nr:hypothetical protein [Datura stramonium]